MLLTFHAFERLKTMWKQLRKISEVVLALSIVPLAYNRGCHLVQTTKRGKRRRFAPLQTQERGPRCFFVIIVLRYVDQSNKGLFSYRWFGR